ncbi:ATP-binding protein [Streptacidiphilus sp. MAP5-52]|uniref:ATP-binding protein n=1 Tax=Streptacidiphilus sp. MAP5-52 TaxID=3156267 RepID=UPI0035153DD7
MRAETVVVRFFLRAVPALVPVARRRAIAQLIGHGVWLDEDATAAVELVVSELVTNAVVHADTDVLTLGLYVRGLRLTIDLHDGNHRLPVRRSADGGSEGGRGLELVEAMSLSNGWAETERGKHVWAELALPKPPPAVVRQRLLQLPPTPRQRVGTFPARTGNSTERTSAHVAVARRPHALARLAG